MEAFLIAVKTKDTARDTRKESVTASMYFLKLAIIGREIENVSVLLLVKQRSVVA
jgi:hypothetical protein